MRRLLASILLLAAAAPIGAIPLLIDAPSSMKAYERQISTIDPASLTPLLELTGSTEPQPPIRIVLAPERSALGESAPPWISGWAFGDLGLIVLVPTRAPRYPDDGLDELLRHEITHVLAARAAGGKEIPRWFDEGLAMFASRGWQLEDRSRLVFELMRGDETPLGQLESLFHSSEGGSARAYAISGAFVRDLILHHGRELPGEILHRLGRGERFDSAFRSAAGESLPEAEARFWRRETIWNRWVPFLTSTFALWMAITLLALWAMAARKARDRAKTRGWEMLDGALDGELGGDGDDDDDDEVVN